MSTGLIMAIVVVVLGGLAWIAEKVIKNKPREECVVCGRTDYRNGGKYLGEAYCTKAHRTILENRENKRLRIEDNFNAFMKEKQKLLGRKDDTNTNLN